MTLFRHYALLVASTYVLLSQGAQMKSAATVATCSSKWKSIGVVLISISIKKNDCALVLVVLKAHVR